MLPIDEDTIVAIATPPGIGGIGIIRISGQLSTLIARQMLRKPCLIPNTATYTDFLSHNGDILDSGIAIFFQAPNSFTGEDVLELQAHGGPVILNILLRRVISLGARIAEPGEFSRRAFLSQKIDLVQAESIISLINAQTEQAAYAAIKSLHGQFSKEINLLLQQLIAARIHLEALIDFPEDDVDDLSHDNIESNLIILEQQLISLLKRANQGVLLNQGVKAVILGKPNVGKSSLLNVLLGEDRVIVTDIPGTTRDVISHSISIDGLLIDFADTAGIRVTDDLVENIGIQKAIKEVQIADLIILIISAEEFLMISDLSISKLLPENLDPNLLINKKLLLLINKIDLIEKADLINKINLTELDSGVMVRNHLTFIFVSIKNHIGIDLLKQQIKQLLEFSNTGSLFIAKERHILALKEVYNHILCAKRVLCENKKTWDLLAEELKLGQQCLSKITGAFSNEDLLDKIFAEFCIGK